jgi:hypothetical protein
VEPPNPVSAGLRRGEILGLRWRDVSLADPAGAALRVRETWVRDQTDTPKSEKSERTIAIGRLAGELFEHRGRSAFQGDDERVFCHPTTGGPMDHKHYAADERMFGPADQKSGKSPPSTDPVPSSTDEKPCAVQGFLVQGRQDSNLQPPVLETGALPVELRPSAATMIPACDGAPSRLSSPS